LTKCDGFNPVVIGGSSETGETEVHDDLIGVVTIHDGPSLPPGEIIAPAVGTEPTATATTTTTRIPKRSWPALDAAAGSTPRSRTAPTSSTVGFGSVEKVIKTVVRSATSAWS